MSAIVIHSAAAGYGAVSASSSGASTRAPPSPTSSARGARGQRRWSGEVVSERTALVRSRPLRESMSTARLVIVCNFVFAIQSTAVPTLSPAISSHFNHAELASYLGSVFSLANTAGIPVYGVLIDSLGRKTAMLAACTLFGLGTVACALAPSMGALIAGRALAGFGGGGLISVSAVINTDLVHLRDRGFFQGLVMTVFGIGAILGGPLSGWLADRYGWQVAFWIPVIAFCMTVVGLFLPEPPIPPTHRSLLAGLRSLDWVGTLLLLSAVGSLILGLSLHTSYLRPWADPAVLGTLVASAVSLVAFAVAQDRVKRPLIPLSLVADRRLLTIFSSAFLLSTASAAVLYHIPIYFAVVVGSSSAGAGLVLSLCGGIGLASGTLLAGYLIRRSGQYRVLGIVSLVPGVVTPIVATYWTPDWPAWAYYVTVFPSSVGYAMFLCVGLVALVSSIDSRMMPKAMALLYTVRALGATLGVSLGASIQIGALVAHLKTQFADIPDADAIIQAVLHSKAAIAGLDPDHQRRALDAYAGSLRIVWLAGAAAAALTLAAAFGVQQNDVHRKEAEETAAAPGDGAVGEGLGPAAIRQ